MTTTRLRFVATALAAAAVALGLPACSSSSAADESLVYWATQQSGSIAVDRALLTTELHRFTTQTGIKVHLEIPTWDVLYGKILTAVAGGEGPDVLNIGNTWSAALQATGAFLPFDAATMRTIDGTGRFVAPALATAGAPGRTATSVPLYGQVYALYYNKALFRAAGITRPPGTWQEFVADAKRLTRPGQWGVALPGASGAMNAHFAFILGRQNGAQLFGATGRPQLDSAAERAAVRQYVDLLATDHVINPSSAEDSGFGSQDDLAHGKVAMTFAQSSAVGYFKTLHFAGYGVAPIPTLDPLPSGGVDVQSMIGGINLSVFKSSAHRAAALRLVRFLTSDAEQIRLNQAYGSLPVVTSAYSAPAFRNPEDRTFESVLTRHAEPMPRVAAEAKMEAVVGDAMAALWAKAAVGPVTSAAVSAALHAANEKLAGPP